MELATWFKSIDPTISVYTPEAWAARGEDGGRKALCIVVHDGGEFSRYGSLVAWNEFKKAFPDCWDEPLTGWATAIYPKALQLPELPKDTSGPTQTPTCS